MKQMLYFMALCVVFVCCRNNAQEDQEYMTFSNIKKVNSFPELQTLKRDNMQPVNMPDYFIKNFVVRDSLLFVDTNQESGLMDIISLNSMKSHGCYLHKGKAKGEFLYGINLTLQTTFECKNDSCYANIYDPITACVFNVNISRTIMEKHASLTLLKFHIQLFGQKQ